MIDSSRGSGLGQIDSLVNKGALKKLQSTLAAFREQGEGRSNHIDENAHFRLNQRIQSNTDLREKVLGERE